jgi:hypothetical protein
MSIGCMKSDNCGKFFFTQGGLLFTNRRQETSKINMKDKCSYRTQKYLGQENSWETLQVSHVCLERMATEDMQYCLGLLLHFEILFFIFISIY